MKLSKILAGINKDYNEIIVNRDINLEVDIGNVRGKDFYEALSLVTEDFVKDCEKALFEVAEGAKKRYLAKQQKKAEKEKKTGKGKKTDSPKNKYQKFIDQFISLQLDVAHKAYIENSRFTKVIKLNANDFYAYEVYLIAKSQGICLKAAFEQLYKNNDDSEAE